ncbi:ImmA/IrrE family metallo-endopeptidase [Sphingomonas sp. QA11]|uniref:ImmA/IrrE family metallo-endopeptidase n=1 Tax=Sphingomonas sp. QA11 TaxID=2950605 RepID=UPI00234B2F08|nr:ImmA/IrrE family metallo-endopeptidase [Sphingomonas sp. QA11]WCM26339.1 ImmA/IrrE family metallo-endopeptidase [Sphingomonas sp. QA11]
MTVTALQKHQLRQRARDLLAAQHVKAAPVPIDRVAKNLGITVRYAPLEDELSGMAFIKDGQRFVVINALHHPNRQRFTAAHEIAHHVLHPHIFEQGVHVDKVILLKRDMLAASGTDDIEIQANTFASELLIPEPLITSILDQSFDFNDEARMMELARKFRVSLAALQYRIAALD